MRDYRPLDFWRRAHKLAIAIHRMVAQRLRGREFTKLRAQLTTAADSIPANIVEGCGADTTPEYARFLGVSIKSASETEYHLLSARDRGALPTNEWGPLSDETEQIRRMIYAYRRKLREDDE